MAKHPHHTRSPHVHARSCSGPIMGSEALGFYLVSKDGEHVPICDIHSLGPSTINEPWRNVLYTGPGQKSVTATKHKRTAKDDALFDFKHVVADRNDIANGGFATIFHSKRRKSYDIWLFGPLLFQGTSYGSIVFEIFGYSDRTVFSKREKNWDMTYWAEFGEVPAGFHRCKVFQTNYFPQAGDTNMRDLTALRAVRANGLAVVPLHPYLRAEWTVLSRNLSQTECQIYDQEGWAGPPP
jgi:hypothetical protein